MEGEFEQIITKIRLSIKATTANFRVSFIDLYFVFPSNFRMVFLPHTNTVILLEPYCGTITEHGLRRLPVFRQYSSHYCKKCFIELFDREFVIILYLALWQQTRTKYVQSFE